MTKSSSPFGAMSLYTQIGERKYLNGTERQQYLDALHVIDCPKERSFCEMIYWTGCRPSEALALHTINIDLSQSMVVICSLKKRGQQKGRHFRAVPVPRDFVKKLDRVHDLTDIQKRSDHEEGTRLWTFGRTKGWRLVRRVMDAAELTGAKSCARGLRHALGVHAAVTRVPETFLQKWLGHSDRDTTAIYLDAIGPEDRAIAKRMWT